MNKLIILIIFWGHMCCCYAQKIAFYSDSLMFTTSCKEVPLFIGKLGEEKDLLKYYVSLKECRFLEDVTSQLEKFKEEYQINDFYMSHILEDYLTALNSKMNSKEQKVIMYCILSYMGYNVRLTNSGNKYFVFAQANTELFNHSSLTIKSKKYYYIHKSPYKGSFSIGWDPINSGRGKHFIFTITKAPLLKYPQYQNLKMPIYERNLIFYDDNSESYLKGKIKELKIDTSFINIVFNKTIIDMYNELPRSNFESYFYLNLSDTLRRQMLLHLKKVNTINTENHLKLLIKFVRGIGEYKTDQEAYKKERPMFPEEALYYQYSDCEDRNALLFYLIKEVLNLPMIILEYPEHINIAVAIKGNYKQSVRHKGKLYYICEASSGSFMVDIGESYAYDKYPNPQIIGEYSPSK